MHTFTHRLTHTNLHTDHFPTLVQTYSWCSYKTISNTDAGKQVCQIVSLFVQSSQWSPLLTVTLQRSHPIHKVGTTRLWHTTNRGWNQKGGLPRSESGDDSFSSGSNTHSLTHPLPLHFFLFSFLFFFFFNTVTRTHTHWWWFNFLKEIVYSVQKELLCIHKC